MSYVKESAASTARRRRRRRAAVTMTLCVLLLVGAFGYAVAYYQRWIGSEAAANPTCTPTTSAPANPLAPANIVVNVYNSTKRSGLAGDTAQVLRERGFDVDVVSNDPLHQDISGQAVIRYGKKGTQEAKKVVAKQLKGAKLVRDARTDASVDVVLGQKFTKLAAPPKTMPTEEPEQTTTC